MDKSGNLYGLTFGGGSSGNGVLYELSKNGTFTVLHSFAGGTSDGCGPVGSVVRDKAGNLYGTTSGGGTANCGTVFRITTDGVLTSLYSFHDCPPGAIGCFSGVDPSSALLLVPSGEFLGVTTGSGPPKYDGMVYRVAPSGLHAPLYTFCSQLLCADGWLAQGALVPTNHGLMGTTSLGGNLDNGTIYAITLAGTLTTYDICTQTGCPNGTDPSTLVQATNGILYGVASQGGSGNGGTVFQMTHDGTITTLYSFCSMTNCADGEDPIDLIQANDGNLYGVTYSGGSGRAGTVFRLTPGGTFTVLYSFCSQPGCVDGANPNGVSQATDGNLYGTVQYGGTCLKACGTIFQLTLSGTLTTLHSFDGSDDGSDGYLPEGKLVQHTDGNLYGTAAAGGDSSNGTVFRLSTGLPPFVEAVLYSGKVGSEVAILGQGLTGATAVAFNGIEASYTGISDTELTAIVPSGATTGFITVTTASGTKLESNLQFSVLP
jgi:uncharacterized repeat protein (TIGR03803 family)